MPRRLVTWLLIAAGVAVLVWTPPVLDQVVNTPGNLSTLSEYLRNPPESPVGLRDAVEVLLVHLNPVRLLQPLVVEDQTRTAGSVVPGGLFLAVWMASVVVARRLRYRPLVRLHLVLAVTLVMALLSISRIFGLVWYYLVLWAWGINALMVLAVTWTALILVARRLDRAARAKAATFGTAGLVGVVVLFTALFTYDATSVEVPTPNLSKTVAALVPRTVGALEQPAVPGGGRNGRYLVTIRDPITIDSTGYALVNELDREGFDIGVLDFHGPGATRYRVRDPADATGVVHLAIGPADIATWRARSGVREVAYTDQRTPKQRADYERLRTEVIDELNAAGLADIVPIVDDNLFGVGLNSRVPDATRPKVVRMLKLGLPHAVFIGPRNAVG